MKYEVCPPPYLAESTRLVLGEIDFAPFLPNDGNDILKAKKHCSVVAQGITSEWLGNVWIMPPPYHSAIFPAVRKFTEECLNGNLKSATFIVKAAVHTVWFRQLCKYCALMRVSEGNSNAKDFRGLSVFYKGDSVDVFKAEFSKYGVCMEPDHTVYNVIP